MRNSHKALSISIEGNLDFVVSVICGGVPEWLKGTGCKPVSIAYVGSNPTPTTTDDLCLAAEVVD